MTGTNLQGNSTTLNNMPEGSSGQEIFLTRTFDAPRELVWKAWTEPDRLMKWWGPKTFTAPAAFIDLRVGGKYLFCMRSPDGQDYWSTGIYREITPFERIVATDSFSDPDGNIVPATYYGMGDKLPLELIIITTFEDLGGKTKITLRHVGFPVGEDSQMASLGWNESLDKLANVLKYRTLVIAEPGKHSVQITRLLDAPRSLVFRAFTDPDLIPRWWGPKKYATIVEKLEAKPGGSWRFVQHNSEGDEFAFHGVFHDVSAPDRIVYTFEFEGFAGHVSLETGTFEEIDGKTQFTGTTVYQSVEDRDAVLMSGMEEGMEESWERLEALVAVRR